jgi:uncharacterized protein YecE (DUF72 family)
MLSFYARHFRTVEINNTFYRPPTAQLLGAWAGQVGPDFRFVLKAPQEITHVKRLAGAEATTAALVETAAALEERLGALLFQLPPNFKKDAPRLRDFLAALPPTCRTAFEFRHASWFTDDVFAMLREHEATLCVADAEDDLEVPFISTAPWGYLRLRRPDYDETTLTEWADRMRAQNWRECFVFFKHEDAGTGPQFATRLLNLLAGAEQRRAG